MGRQEHTCWRCGAGGIPKKGRPSALREIPGGAFAQRQHARQPRTPTTVLGNARATTQAQLDTERWIDEGGSLGTEANVLPTAEETRKRSLRSSTTTAASSHRTGLAAEGRRDTKPALNPQEVHCNADAVRSIPRV